MANVKTPDRYGFLHQRVMCTCGHLEDAVGRTSAELQRSVQFFTQYTCMNCDWEERHKNDPPDEEE